MRCKLCDVSYAVQSNALYGVQPMGFNLLGAIYGVQSTRAHLLEAQWLRTKTVWGRTGNDDAILFLGKDHWIGHTIPKPAGNMPK